MARGRTSDAVTCFHMVPALAVAVASLGAIGPRYVWQLVLSTRFSLEGTTLCMVPWRLRGLPRGQPGAFADREEGAIVASPRRTRFTHRSATGEQTGFITVTLVLEQYGDHWLGQCTELGTSTYGDTADEAWTDLVEAVVLQLSEAEREGYLDAFLADNGVRMEPAPVSAGEELWAIAAGIRDR